MTKSNKRRAGLQKKVSSVFEGVPIPGRKHDDRSYRAPSPQRSAASAPPKPGDSQIYQDPVITRLDQPEESADRTVPAHFTASLPSMSTNRDSSQSLEVGRIDKPETLAARTVPEYMAADTPPTSTDSEGSQNPDAGRPDKPEDVAERTVPEYVATAAPSMSTDGEDSQGPAVGKLDQSEEAADKTVSERAAASPKPRPAEHQSSRNSLIRRMAECEEPSHKPAPVKAEEASHKPAPVKAEEASRKPAPARITESSRKPAPAEPPASDLLAETSEPSLGQQIKDKLATSKLGTSTTKDKMMVMLVPILAIVMIFMFKQVLRKSPGKARGSAKDDTSAVVAANSGDGIEWELPDPMPVAMRDPTKLPSQSNTQSQASNKTQKPKRNGATSGTKTTAMRIRGLFYSTDRSSVVIGDEVAYVGDTINGVTIMGINKDSVEFEKDGETWVQRVRD